MITLQRSNPTVTQILAAHGCQTTAYRIATIHTLAWSSFAFPLGLLRLHQLRLVIHRPMIIISDTSLRGVPVCECGRRTRAILAPSLYAQIGASVACVSFQSWPGEMVQRWCVGSCARSDSTSKWCISRANGPAGPSAWPE